MSAPELRGMLAVRFEIKNTRLMVYVSQPNCKFRCNKKQVAALQNGNTISISTNRENC